ncbi:MAG: hypothetical protein M3548_05455 [Actinomycetota bacterium]|nr:hypothetical protein [Actinomycetota bacterium]
MTQQTLDALARSSGGFAMVAMDQRESLRGMLAEHRDSAVPDGELVRFKLDVAREVAPHGSGFLIDRHFGFDRVAKDGLLPEGCGLILAADALTHTVPGGPVADTALDPAVDPVAARGDGAAALKLLVIWRADDERDRRIAMSAEFVRSCEAAGLVSVLEAVVRPEEVADHDAALIEAATELGALRPNLYKAQVPGFGRGDAHAAARTCEKVTAAVPGPWVVLSQGVRIEDFPASVELACRAGASGFLAGRAVWSDTLGAADWVPLLRERSVPRLRRLADIVDAHARPWQEAR